MRIRKILPDRTAKTHALTRARPSSPSSSSTSSPFSLPYLASSFYAARASSGITRAPLPLSFTACTAEIRRRPPPSRIRADPSAARTRYPERCLGFFSSLASILRRAYGVFFAARRAIDHVAVLVAFCAADAIIHLPRGQLAFVVTVLPPVRIIDRARIARERFRSEARDFLRS